MALRNANLELVEQSILKAKENSDAQRRVSTENRLDLLHDNFHLLIENELANQFSSETSKSIKQMIDDSNNVFKRIVNEVSMVYKAGAKRKAVNENNDVDERYDFLNSSIPFDITMAGVNQLTNACNEIFVRVSPRNERLELDIITPDRVTVVQNTEDPTKYDALVYRKTFIDSLDKVVDDYVYFDVFGNHFVYDKNMTPYSRPLNPDNVNWYKDPKNPGRTIIPVPCFHRQMNTNAVFDNTGGNDLYSLSIQTGVLLTYFNYLLKMNSFKQLVLTGWDTEVTKALAKILDPAYPLATKSPDAKADVLDYQINLDAFYKSINSKVISVANNYGVSADQLQMSISAQSGFSLQIKREGLNEVRTNQIKHYRWYEKELFEIMRIVNNTHYDQKISDSAKFSIDFIEPAAPTDDAEVRENWKFDIEVGAKSIVDYVQFKNPDLDTEEKALQALAKNMELNKKAQLATGINIETLFANMASKSAGPNTLGSGGGVTA